MTFIGSKSGTFLRVKNKAEVLHPSRIFECGTNELTVVDIRIRNDFAKVVVKVSEGFQDIMGQ
jgi:hypothetical protein